MYGDFSRLITKLTTKLSALYMQQGRIQLDSDWNLQTEVNQKNQHTYLKDVIGYSGVPQNNAGFGIYTDKNTLFISQGNFYLNGVLCENSLASPLAKQPYHEDNNTTYKRGFYLAYLDTWQRTTTWVDEPALQEVALSTDTCVATQTAWQVKLVKLSTKKQLEEQVYIHEHNLAIECLPFGGIEKVKENELEVNVVEHIDVNFGHWQKILHEKSGQLKLNIAEEGAAFNNYLYRIEIHDTGGVYGLKNHKHTPQYVIKPTETPGVFKFNEHTHLNVWQIGQIVELFIEQAIGDLATITAINLKDHTISVEFHDKTPKFKSHHKKLHIRSVATYKWSRNNASLVTKVTNIDDDTITIVEQENLSEHLIPGAWIELRDLTHYNTHAGILLQIKQVESDKIIVVDASALAHAEFTSPITLRLWDSNKIIIRHGQDLPLENGITTHFYSPNYQTQHYWCCHTRNFRQHDWPTDENGNTITQTSFKHHQLAMLALVAFDGDKWITSPHWDFRHTFPPLTETNQSGHSRPLPTNQSSSNDATVLIDNELPKDGIVIFEQKQAPKNYTATGASLVTTCWDRLTDLPIACRDSAITTIGESIYVIGGVDPEGNYLATTYQFNTQTNEWQQKADMPTSRANLGVAAVNNKVYAIGGQALDKEGLPISVNYVEVYDPDTDKWQIKKPMPFGSYSFAIAVVKETIYILGGGAETHKGSIFHKLHNLIDKGLHHGHYNQQYNTKRDSWNLHTSIPTPRFGLTACVLNDRIHTFGGTDGKKALKTHEIYDPKLNLWSTETELSIPRFAATAVTTVNNKILILGGHDGTNFLSSVEEYDNHTKLWNEFEELPIARAGSATTILGQQIYTIGGELADLGLLVETLRLTLNKRFYLHRYNGVKL